MVDKQLLERIRYYVNLSTSCQKDQAIEPSAEENSRLSTFHATEAAYINKLKSQMLAQEQLTMKVVQRMRYRIEQEEKDRIRKEKEVTGVDQEAAKRQLTTQDLKRQASGINIACSGVTVVPDNDSLLGITLATTTLDNQIRTLIDSNSLLDTRLSELKARIQREKKLNEELQAMKAMINSKIAAVQADLAKPVSDFQNDIDDKIGIYTARSADLMNLLKELIAFCWKHVLVDLYRERNFSQADLERQRKANSEIIEDLLNSMVESAALSSSSKTKHESKYVKIKNANDPFIRILLDGNIVVQDAQDLNSIRLRHYGIQYN